jgi:hypothetical protein
MGEDKVQHITEWPASKQKQQTCFDQQKNVATWDQQRSRFICNGGIMWNITLKGYWLVAVNPPSHVNATKDIFSYGKRKSYVSRTGPVYHKLHLLGLWPLPKRGEQAH